METRQGSWIGHFLIPNENPMTLGGTNAYILGAPGADSVTLVDPGTEDPALLDALVGGRNVDLVLLTHHHLDHSAGGGHIHRFAGAPVRAWRADLCLGAAPLEDGEQLDASGIGLRVIHTPGHTSDSVCFHAPVGAEHGILLSGDTILGRGTTIIEHPDGLLADYLDSLDKLEALGRARVLPGHGPILDGVADAAVEYRSRRLHRLAQLQETLADFRHAPVSELAKHIYPTKTHPRTRRAAERTILAQLRYLGDPRGTTDLG